jgi:uncharacterized protein YkwD
MRRPPVLRSALLALLVVCSLAARPRIGPSGSLERSTLAAINVERRDRGLRPLVASEDLARVAREHSEDQARSGRSGHAGSDGSEPADRVRRGGIAYRLIGENVAMNRGYGDPVYVAVHDWMESPGHRRNILDPRFVQTGVGVVVAPDGSFYFTQVFLEPAPPPGPDDLSWRLSPAR